MTYRQTRAHQAIIMAANSSRYGNDGVSDSMENNWKKPASRYRSLKMTSSRMSPLTGMVVGACHRDSKDWIELQSIYFMGLSNEQPRYTISFRLWKRFKEIIFWRKLTGITLVALLKRQLCICSRHTKYWRVDDQSVLGIETQTSLW